MSMVDVDTVIMLVLQNLGSDGALAFVLLRDRHKMGV